MRTEPVGCFHGLQPRNLRAIGRAWLVVAAIVALSAAAAPAGAQTLSGGLFSPAEPSALCSAAATPPSGSTIRRREVTIDFDLLENARASASERNGTPARLTLNLFDDTVLTAIVDRTAPTSTGYSLSGRIEGVEHGTMTLVLNGVVVAGSVRTPSGTYRIRSADTGLYAISQVDEARLPPTR